MPSENQNWTKKIFRNFEGFVEGVIYDRDLSISARLLDYSSILFPIFFRLLLGQGFFYMAKEFF